MPKRRIPSDSDFSWVFPIWSVKKPESLLSFITPQLRLELLESSLSQLKDGLADLGGLYDLAQTSEEYDSFIRGAHRLLAESENPVDMLNRLHRVLVYSIAAGWVSCLAGVHCRVMDTFTWTSAQPDQHGSEPPARSADTTCARLMAFHPIESLTFANSSRFLDNSTPALIDHAGDKRKISGDPAG